MERLTLPESTGARPVSLDDPIFDGVRGDPSGGPNLFHFAAFDYRTPFSDRNGDHEHSRSHNGGENHQGLRFGPGPGPREGEGLPKGFPEKRLTVSTTIPRSEFDTRSSTMSAMTAWDRPSERSPVWSGGATPSHHYGNPSSGNSSVPGTVSGTRSPYDDHIDGHDHRFTDSVSNRSHHSECFANSAPIRSPYHDHHESFVDSRYDDRHVPLVSYESPLRGPHGMPQTYDSEPPRGSLRGDGQPRGEASSRAQGPLCTQSSPIGSQIVGPQQPAPASRWYGSCVCHNMTQYSDSRSNIQRHRSPIDTPTLSSPIDRMDRRPDLQLTNIDFDRPLDRISSRISSGISDRVTDRMSDRASDCMLDRMLDSTSAHASGFTIRDANLEGDTRRYSRNACDEHAYHPPEVQSFILGSPKPKMNKNTLPGTRPTSRFGLVNHPGMSLSFGKNSGVKGSPRGSSKGSPKVGKQVVGNRNGSPSYYAADTNSKGASPARKGSPKIVSKGNSSKGNTKASPKQSPNKKGGANDEDLSDQTDEQDDGYWSPKTKTIGKATSRFDDPLVPSKQKHGKKQKGKISDALRKKTDKKKRESDEKGWFGHCLPLHSVFRSNFQPKLDSVQEDGEASTPDYFGNVAAKTVSGKAIANVTGKSITNVTGKKSGNKSIVNGKLINAQPITTTTHSITTTTNSKPGFCKLNSKLLLADQIDHQACKLFSPLKPVESQCEPYVVNGAIDGVISQSNVLGTSSTSVPIKHSLRDSTRDQESSHTHQSPKTASLEAAALEKRAALELLSPKFEDDNFDKAGKSSPCSTTFPMSPMSMSSCSTNGPFCRGNPFQNTGNFNGGLNYENGISNGASQPFDALYNHAFKNHPYTDGPLSHPGSEEVNLPGREVVNRMIELSRATRRRHVPSGFGNPNLNITNPISAIIDQKFDFKSAELTSAELSPEDVVLDDFKAELKREVEFHAEKIVDKAFERVATDYESITGIIECAGEAAEAAVGHTVDEDRAEELQTKSMLCEDRAEEVDVADNDIGDEADESTGNEKTHRKTEAPLPLAVGRQSSASSCEDDPLKSSAAVLPAAQVVKSSSTNSQKSSQTSSEKMESTTTLALKISNGTPQCGTQALRISDRTTLAKTGGTCRALYVTTPVNQSLQYPRTGSQFRSGGDLRQGMSTAELIGRLHDFCVRYHLDERAKVTMLGLEKEVLLQVLSTPSSLIEASNNSSAFIGMRIANVRAEYANHRNTRGYLGRNRLSGGNLSGLSDRASEYSIVSNFFQDSPSAEFLKTSIATPNSNVGIGKGSCKTSASGRSFISSDSLSLKPLVQKTATSFAAIQKTTDSIIQKTTNSVIQKTSGSISSIERRSIAVSKEGRDGRNSEAYEEGRNSHEKTSIQNGIYHLTQGDESEKREKKSRGEGEKKKGGVRACMKAAGFLQMMLIEPKSDKITFETKTSAKSEVLPTTVRTSESATSETEILQAATTEVNNEIEITNEMPEFSPKRIDVSPSQKHQKEKNAEIDGHSTEVLDDTNATKTLAMEKKPEASGVHDQTDTNRSSTAQVSSIDGGVSCVGEAVSSNSGTEQVFLKKETVTQLAITSNRRKKRQCIYLQSCVFNETGDKNFTDFRKLALAIRHHKLENPGSPTAKSGGKSPVGIGVTPSSSKGNVKSRTCSRTKTTVITVNKDCVGVPQAVARSALERQFIDAVLDPAMGPLTGKGNGRRPRRQCHRPHRPPSPAATKQFLFKYKLFDSAIPKLFRYLPDGVLEVMEREPRWISTTKVHSLTLYGMLPEEWVNAFISLSITGDPNYYANEPLTLVGQVLGVLSKSTSQLAISDSAGKSSADASENADAADAASLKSTGKKVPKAASPKADFAVTEDDSPPTTADGNGDDWQALSVQFPALACLASEKHAHPYDATEADATLLRNYLLNHPQKNTHFVTAPIFEVILRGIYEDNRFFTQMCASEAFLRDILRVEEGVSDQLRQCWNEANLVRKMRILSYFYCECQGWFKYSSGKTVCFGRQDVDRLSDTRLSSSSNEFIRDTTVTDSNDTARVSNMSDNMLDNMSLFVGGNAAIGVGIGNGALDGAMDNAIGDAATKGDADARAALEMDEGLSTPQNKQIASGFVDTIPTTPSPSTFIGFARSRIDVQKEVQAAINVQEGHGSGEKETAPPTPAANAVTPGNSNQEPRRVLSEEFLIECLQQLSIEEYAVQNGLDYNTTSRLKKQPAWVVDVILAEGPLLTAHNASACVVLRLNQLRDAKLEEIVWTFYLDYRGKKQLKPKNTWHMRKYSVNLKDDRVYYDPAEDEDAQYPIVTTNSNVHVLPPPGMKDPANDQMVHLVTTTATTPGTTTAVTPSTGEGGRISADEGEGMEKDLDKLEFNERDDMNDIDLNLMSHDDIDLDLSPTKNDACDEELLLRDMNHDDLNPEIFLEEYLDKYEIRSTRVRNIFHSAPNEVGCMVILGGPISKNAINPAAVLLSRMNRASRILYGIDIVGSGRLNRAYCRDGRFFGKIYDLETRMEIIMASADLGGTPSQGVGKGGMPATNGTAFPRIYAGSKSDPKVSTLKGLMTESGRRYQVDQNEAEGVEKGGKGGKKGKGGSGKSSSGKFSNNGKYNSGGNSGKGCENTSGKSDTWGNNDWWGSNDKWGNNDRNDTRWNKASPPDGKWSATDGGKWSANDEERQGKWTPSGKTGRDSNKHKSSQMAYQKKLNSGVDNSWQGSSEFISTAAPTDSQLHHQNSCVSRTHTSAFSYVNQRNSYASQQNSYGHFHKVDSYTRYDPDRPRYDNEPPRYDTDRDRARYDDYSNTPRLNDARDNAQGSGRDAQGRDYNMQGNGRHYAPLGQQRDYRDVHSERMRDGHPEPTRDVHSERTLTDSTGSIHHLDPLRGPSTPFSNGILHQERTPAPSKHQSDHYSTPYSSKTSPYSYIDRSRNADHYAGIDRSRETDPRDPRYDGGYASRDAPRDLRDGDRYDPRDADRSPRDPRDGDYALDIDKYERRPIDMGSDRRYERRTPDTSVQEVRDGYNRDLPRYDSRDIPRYASHEMLRYDGREYRDDVHRCVPRSYSYGGTQPSDKRGLYFHPRSKTGYEHGTESVSAHGDSYGGSKEVATNPSDDHSLHDASSKSTHPSMNARVPVEHRQPPSHHPPAPPVGGPSPGGAHAPPNGYDLYHADIYQGSKDAYQPSQSSHETAVYQGSKGRVTHVVSKQSDQQSIDAYYHRDDLYAHRHQDPRYQDDRCARRKVDEPRREAVEYAARDYVPRDMDPPRGGYATAPHASPERGYSDRASLKNYAPRDLSAGQNHMQAVQQPVQHYQNGIAAYYQSQRVPQQTESVQKEAPQQDASVHQVGGVHQQAYDTQYGYANHLQQPGHGNHLQQPGHGNHLQQPGPGNHLQQPGPGNHLQQPGHGNHLQQSGYGNHLQLPGHGNHLQQPGYGNHMQQPVYGNHLQEPGHGNHLQQPGYGNHMQQPGYGNQVHHQVQQAPYHSGYTMEHNGLTQTGSSHHASSQHGSSSSSHAASSAYHNSHHNPQSVEPKKGAQPQKGYADSYW